MLQMCSVGHDVSNLIRRVDRCLSGLLDTHQLSADAKKIDIPAMLATRHSNCLRDIIDSVRQNDYTSVFVDMVIGDVTVSEILAMLPNTRKSIERKMQEINNNECPQNGCGDS